MLLRLVIYLKYCSKSDTWYMTIVSSCMMFPTSIICKVVFKNQYGACIASKNCYLIYIILHSIWAPGLICESPLTLWSSMIQEYADEFYKSHNNTRFNSIEDELCRLVYVAKVETVKSSHVRKSLFELHLIAKYWRWFIILLMWTRIVIIKCVSIHSKNITV